MYGSVAGVQAMVAMIGDILSQSIPAEDQVAAWLEATAARIDRTLAGAGYVVPVSATATVYPELVELNDLYPAGRVLQSRGIDTRNAAGESRSAEMFAEFERRLSDLVESDLAAAGVLPSTGSTGAGSRVRSRQIVRVDRQL